MKAGPVLTFLMVLRLGSGYTTFEVRMPDVSPKKVSLFNLNNGSRSEQW